MVAIYGKIYKIEAEVQEMLVKPIHQEPLNSQKALQLRQTMDPHFQEIYNLSCEILMESTPTLGVGQAANYFLKNLRGLTEFMGDLDIPINNFLPREVLEIRQLGAKPGWAHIPKKAH